MSFVTLRTVLFMALLVVGYSSFCQQMPDSATLAYKPEFAIQQAYYQDEISLTKLYNGPEYVDYTKLYTDVIGHQFFLSNQMTNGNITYDNHLFNNVRIAYDIARNQVVVQHANNPFTLKLISKDIQNFTIDGHYFEQLVADSSSNVVQTGFYELLSDNGFRIFAQRKKTGQEKIDQKKIILEFMSDSRFYLENGKKIYDINNKKQLVMALGSKDIELKKYIKTNKLKFDTKRRENSIMSTVNYFNQLPH